MRRQLTDAKATEMAVSLAANSPMKLVQAQSRVRPPVSVAVCVCRYVCVAMCVSLYMCRYVYVTTCVAMCVRVRVCDYCILMLY